MTRPRTLILPGWLDSGADHWQSRWERLHGFERVTQDDWLWPRRGDWMARLDEVIISGPHNRPVRLVAHSLGCHLVAAWAAHSAHTARVAATLLVAPPDLERDDMPPNVQTWRPIARQHLPFAACTLLSSDDPYCSASRALEFAQAWGSDAVSVGAAGHINGESGLGDWPQGLAWLDALSPPSA
jgi:predicted alpha/beta hydrolase family esterase